MAIELEYVPCPVCKGAKQLGHQKPGGCLCCEGKGKITKGHDETLRLIRKDLAAKLRERGITF